MEVKFWKDNNYALVKTTDISINSRNWFTEESTDNAWRTLTLSSSLEVLSYY